MHGCDVMSKRQRAGRHRQEDKEHETGRATLQSLAGFRFVSLALRFRSSYQLITAGFSITLFGGSISKQLQRYNPVACWFSVRFFLWFDFKASTKL